MENQQKTWMSLFESAASSEESFQQYKVQLNDQIKEIKENIYINFLSKEEYQE